MGTAAIVAIIAKHEREIVDAFQRAGATSAERAVDPDTLGVDDAIAFDRLRRDAVLREAAGGAYFFDALTWQAVRSRRRRLVFVVVAMLAVAAALMLLRQRAQ